MNLIPKYKTAYIHGRPSGHPIHDLLARRIGATFIPVDFILQWHENPKSGKLKRYLSWILCALFFPSKKKYSVFFTESVREPLLFMKLFHLVNKNQKLVALMDNETLYFYKTGRYTKASKWLVKKFLEKSDALLCVGEFQAGMAREILPMAQHTKIKTINNWVFNEKSEELKKMTPDLASDKILFIGDVSAPFRVWYKGLDLMLRAFIIAAKENKQIIFELLGVNDPSLIENFLTDVDPGIKSRILIHTRKPINDFLNTVSLCLHCARGEAWGISIMEALQAGVPVITSKFTGAKEVVEKVSPELVLPLDENLISEKIKWYFSLSRVEKKALSEKGRNVMEEYSEEKSLERFDRVYSEILKSFE